MKKLLITKLCLALSVPAFAFTPFTLNQIDFQGVNKDQQDDLLKLLNLKSGQRITEEDVAETIKALYSTGNFENVTINKVNNNLTVDVILKPKIAVLNFQGNSLLPTEQIRKIYEENAVKQGAALDENKISDLNLEVEKFYQGAGYNQASVNTKYETLKDGSIKVTVIIDEQKKAFLKSVKLTGNKAYTLDDLLSDSRIRPDQHWYNFYHNSNFNAQNQADFLKNIESFYKDRGYAKFKIISTNSSFPDKEHPSNLDFSIDIYEGNVYKVESVSFFTRDTNLKDKLSKLIDIKLNSIYDESKIDALVYKAKNYFSELGYAKAKVEPVFRFNEAENKVSVILAVEPGPRYTIAKIDFKGNNHTKDYVIRRMLQQQENALFHIYEVEDDISSLMRSGFFQEANYEITPVQGTTDQLDLVYKVKEASNGSFTFGLGYGDSEGLSGNIKFSQRNFLGTGRAFGADSSVSKGKKSVSLNYTEPFITNSGLSLSSSLYYTKVDTAKFHKFNSYTYKQEVLGLSVGTGFNVSKYGSVNLSVGFEKNKFYNLNPEYYRALYLNSIGQSITKGVWKVRTKNITLSATYNYNTYDRYLFPTKGIDFTLSGSYTGLASTDKYISSFASLKGYLPLDSKGKWVIGARSAINYAKAFDHKYLPVNALYTVGGFGTLRGLAYGSVGPVSIYCPFKDACSTKRPELFNSKGGTLGGDISANGGLDFIFPLFTGEAGKTVRTSLFIDTASAWSTQWKTYTKDLTSIKDQLKGVENFGKPKWRVTAGINLEWNSPLGLLSFSLAKPIKKEVYDDAELFSINFGSSF